MSLYGIYKKFCEKRQATGKFRILPEVARTAGEEIVDFSTNDYLALSDAPTVLAAATEAARRYGAGATGSRLLSGNLELFTTLERQIARDKETEAALIFNSGFQANSSVLSSLLDRTVHGKTPIVFFDRFNHASLYQGVFLSGAQLVRYRHCCMKHLASLLEKYRHDPAPRFIVTESLFGMDGDKAPLPEIIRLARQYNAFLYIDEAHATGVAGVTGYGLSTGQDFSGVPYLVMGTFSKGLGCSGAYVACAADLKDYLVNHCAGFVYSTALSPMIVGAIQAAWEAVRVSGPERSRLFAMGEMLRRELREAGWNTGSSQTHIVPVLFGNESAVMEAKERLMQHGMRVSAIRPPTVPPQTSRLRIALTARHTEADIARLLAAFRRL